jgi:hypothetical protein
MDMVWHYDVSQALAIFQLTLSPEFAHHQFRCFGIPEHVLSLVAARCYEIDLTTY